MMRIPSIRLPIAAAVGIVAVASCSRGPAPGTPGSAADSAAAAASVATTAPDVRDCRQALDAAAAAGWRTADGPDRSPTGAELAGMTAWVVDTALVGLLPSESDSATRAAVPHPPEEAIASVSIFTADVQAALGAPLGKVVCITTKPAN